MSGVAGICEAGRAASPRRPAAPPPRRRRAALGLWSRALRRGGTRRGSSAAGRAARVAFRSRSPAPFPGRRAPLGRVRRCRPPRVPGPRPPPAPGGHAGERMTQRDTLVHLFAGGCGGTVGAILTCPLEVVKTRLQSSSVTLYISEVQLNTMAGASVNRVVSPGPLHCLKVILEKEGPRSLFRGLGPNLVGVAPSRAIYFAAYSNCKEKLNGIFDPDSTQVHMISAAMAGFTAITATNPIWLIKTRLQLDARNRGEKRMGAFECIRKVYQTDGLRGFYRGMSASYAGISETVIHFVIYESIKQKLLEYKIASTMENDEESVKEASDFVGMMLAAATSKTCATTIAYPHEVVRTRLREEGTKYRSFFQTLSLVVQEEGYGSLYRGLTTHLVRQIPNTAIMMATYELVVYLLNG
ncbi:solute carrier family 25 member 36 [Canis lupus dingo]|uniref:Solute carrier family 25 member 36 n=1 Tax=Canis lupus familiaris TaxID=9615 RepID=A0A8C0Q4H7_CANLF|nr:solute carrier family 25 member 36 [Canis lupus dingo]